MSDPRTDFPYPDAPVYRCRAAVAGLHKAPDIGSAIDDQVLFGQTFKLAKTQGDWAYGQVQPLCGAQGGYVGRVILAALEPAGSAPSHQVNIIKAPIFARADLKSPIQGFLSFGSLITAGAQDGDYVNIGPGYLHAAHLTPAGRLGAAYDNDPLYVATNYIGTPYVWGGKSGDGVDCSGLVQMCLWATGRDCPRDADQQEAQLGTDVEIRADLSGLQRGDLVFWKGHVGIMDDAFDLVHANAHHMMTTVEPLNDAARRIKKSAGPITSIKRL